MWAKPIEVNNDYTEVDTEGHIIRINGKPFQEYLAVQCCFLFLFRIKELIFVKLILLIRSFT